MTVDDELFPIDPMRDRQEHEIAVTHALSEVEHALATEARALSLVFEEADVTFDAMTFVALRLISECIEADIEPADLLTELHDRGVLERAVALANDSRPDRDAR